MFRQNFQTTIIGLTQAGLLWEDGQNVLSLVEEDGKKGGGMKEDHVMKKIVQYQILVKMFSLCFIYNITLVMKII